jgi:chaperonin GroES
MIAFKKLRPLMNRVLVQKPEPLTKTKGGILIPENARQDALNVGTVIAVGPGRTLDNGTVRPCIVK